MSSLCALRLPEGQASLYSSRAIEIIDCLQLPHTIQWHTVRTSPEAFEAIKSMKIRGAPAIASLAAVAIACELLNILDEGADANTSALSSQKALSSWLDDRSNYLLSSRPTAVNLREAMHRLQAIAAGAAQEDGTRETAQKIVQAAELIWTEDVARNVLIGDNGAHWLLQKLEGEGAIQAGEKINVLTVCNTGSLATSVRLRLFGAAWPSLARVECDWPWVSCRATGPHSASSARFTVSTASITPSSPRRVHTSKGRA